jgi:predicted ATPase
MILFAEAAPLSTFALVEALFQHRINHVPVERFAALLATAVSLHPRALHCLHQLVRANQMEHVFVSTGMISRSA